MIKQVSRLFVVMVGMVLLHGCSLTNFPLILSSSVEKTFHVNAGPEQQFADTVFVNLADIRNTANIDSAKFYNLTLLIDSNSTPNTKISGFITVDTNTIVTLSSASTTDFSVERSIFDTSLVGWKYGSTGVTYLTNILGEQNPPTVTIIATLNPLLDSVHCNIHVRIYGQLFTKN